MNQRPTLLKPLGPASLADVENFSIGDIRARPSLREVEANGVLETLEPRVMQVLVALARAKGGVLSRDELIRQCWGGRIVGEDAINRCVSKVRQLAELGGRKAFEIETIPRVGYRLIPNSILPSISDPPPSPLAWIGSRLRLQGTRVWPAIGLVAVMLLIVAFAVSRFPSPGNLSSSSSSSSSSHISAPVTLAVLPFSNMSGDPAQEFFSDGMTEEVDGALSNISGLRIIARRSAFQFKNQKSRCEKRGASAWSDGHRRRGHTQEGLPCSHIGAAHSRY